MRVTWRCGQGRVQYLGELFLLGAPLRNGAGVVVGSGVAQSHAGQVLQNGFNIIHAHTKAHAHMAQGYFFVQVGVSGDDTAHQYIAASTGIFG